MASKSTRALMLSMTGLLALAGGCVSEDQYKEALAAGRRANEQLVACQNALRDVRLQNQQLQDAIKGRDDAITARNQQIGQLQEAHNQLLASFNELNDKYKKLAATDVGPISAIVLPAGLDKALREFARNNPDILEYLPEYGMVKLKSDLTFEPGSVAIKTTSGDALRQFVGILQGAEAAKFNVFIAGHTDDIPIRKPETKKHHPNNWYLSVHRAVAVQVVMARAGLDPKRIAVMGFGEYHPIAPNAPGNKGNVLNRRVELWIVPPDRFLTASER